MLVAESNAILNFVRMAAHYALILPLWLLRAAGKVQFHLDRPRGRIGRLARLWPWLAHGIFFAFDILNSRYYL